MAKMDSKQYFAFRTLSSFSGQSNKHVVSEDLFNFLLQEGIIRGDVRCDNCRLACSLRLKPRVSDGHIWQCNRCKKQISIRKGTIFAGSKLPLHNIMKIMNLWAARVSGFQALSLIPSVSKNAVYDWYACFRGIAKKRIEEDGVLFTGDGVDISVQIDESLFGKKQKYHRGKKYNQTWVFGISQPAQI